MAPLHSLVDNVRMNIRCRQKEGVTLRHSYLSAFFLSIQKAFHPYKTEFVLSNSMLDIPYVGCLAIDTMHQYRWS